MTANRSIAAPGRVSRIWTIAMRERVERTVRRATFERRLRRMKHECDTDDLRPARFRPCFVTSKRRDHSGG
jgi:hypothetical protein